ncbi:hypothetical protein ABW45_04650 [Stenotrophomonas maltophilia]|nr:hypothetical protein ABW45_04650 [Stenotrophomonas maltophilia]
MNLEQIDTSTTAGKAEVMRLAAEGRRVAARLNLRSSEIWTEMASPKWEWGRVDYAIIDEPVGPEEVWFTVINGCIDGRPYTFECTAVDRAQTYGGQPVKYIRADLAGEKG